MGTDSQDHQLLLQAPVTVSNRSESTVHVEFDGDLWEADIPDGRLRPMRPEMLLGPQQDVTVLLRGGVSLKEWAEIDAQARAGQDGDPVVRATVTAPGDADEGALDVWRPWLTGTPIAEDPTRGSIWRLTSPPPFADGHGGWCQQFDLQPPRQRSYWPSRKDGRPLPPPEERLAK